VLFGLDNKTKEEHIFTKAKADWFFSSKKTVFHHKDDETEMLQTLRSLKQQAIEEQKKLDEKGLQNIYQENGRLVMLVFDEAHSYLRSGSGTKEDKEQRAEIISIVNWFLRQARSVGYICVFIMPNAEKDQIDINIRDCAYFFSTKLSSEQVSTNIFRSPTAFLIPPKRGLFVGTNGDQVRVFQAPYLNWDKK
jgi:hypothetical protein